MRNFSRYSFPHEPLLSEVEWARSAFSRDTCARAPRSPARIHRRYSPSVVLVRFGPRHSRPARINSHFRTPSRSGSASTSVESVVYSRAFRTPSTNSFPLPVTENNSLLGQSLRPKLSILYARVFVLSSLADEVRPGSEYWASREGTTPSGNRPNTASQKLSQTARNVQLKAAPCQAARCARSAGLPASVQRLYAATLKSLLNYRPRER